MRPSSLIKKKQVIAGYPFCCLLTKPFQSLRKDLCKKKKKKVYRRMFSPEKTVPCALSATVVLWCLSEYLPFSWSSGIWLIDSIFVPQHTPRFWCVVCVNTYSCRYLTWPAVPFSRIYLPSPQGIISHHSAGMRDRRAEEAHTHHYWWADWL